MLAICSSSMKTDISPTSEKSVMVVKKVARRDAVLVLAAVLAAQIGQRGREQGAAQAVADGVDGRLPGRLLDLVEGVERTFEHVVLEALRGEALVRIDPGDHEDGMALIDRPLDEAVLLAQVQDVELVDPGRHDQQRPLGTSAVVGVYWTNCIRSFW